MTRTDSGQGDHSDAQTREVHHALTDEDRHTIASMRSELLRPPFDDVMEQTPGAEGVACEKGMVGGVAGIWCRPRDARPGGVIVYLHGGAYVFGSAKASAHLAGQLAARTRLAVFAAEYRLAPEHPFPAAVADATAVYRGLAAQGLRLIAIAGDSAGGGLALVLLSIAQSEVSGGGVAPIAGVAMSPWTDLALTGQSLQDCAEADPLLTVEMLRTTAASYLKGHDARDPLASPLYGDLTGLPPVQLHVGTSELLLDDSRRYAERARAKDVRATVHVWEGMTHVFPASLGTLAAAGNALEVIAAFLVAQLDTASITERA